MLTNPSNNSETKRALILAGGGMRVAYQSGVLMALEESGLKFAHVDGTSGGIFNTAMLASGISPKSMAENWRQLKLSHFVSGRKAKNYLKPLKMQGYADADNIRNKVFPALGIDLNKIQNNQNAYFTFNVCNFSQKKIEAINVENLKEDHLIAGVSLPIFMPALMIDSDWYSDAVWIKDANLTEAIHQGADELWLVWAIGNSHTYLNGAFHQYVHMIEMSANGGLLGEYKQIKLYDQLNNKEKPTKLFVIKSQVPLPLDPDFFFNKVNARELINMGYSHAKSYLLNHGQNGEKLDETATQCQEPVQLLCFRGSYQGDLSFGSSKLPVSFFTYHQYGQFPNEKNALETYSSIQIGKDQEIALYGHKLKVSKENGGIVHYTSSHFIWNQEVHKLTSSQKVNGVWEIYTGLGFKHIHVKIEDKSENIIAEGLLYQSLQNRLKSRYFMNKTTTTPGKDKHKSKFQLIKDYTEYGI